MEILSVTLKNFKSHSDRHFLFQPGTNAICGENGAGKTSILEAIAWTLFNYRGAYKTEDLIRNGAGSAQAIIEFVSSRDGRTYAVKRCTTTGYTIYDPQLGESLDYKRIDDEIMPWLRQHLGVAPGTDLGRLFANTIGVPQGTFTADFLQPPENRKKIFDAVLKVEEYRQANQQMLSLEKYAKVEVEMLERAIAQYEERLQEQIPLQQEHQALSQEIQQDEAQLHQLQADLMTLQVERERLVLQAHQIQQQRSQLQQLTLQRESKQQAIEVLKQSVQRSEQAVQICTAHRESYQTYLQVEEILQQLDQQMRQRQAFIQQREKLQKVAIEQQTELTRLQLQLETIANATTQIEQLQPLIQQQEALEQQQAAIVEQLNQLQAYKLEQQTISRQLTKFQADCTAIANAIDRIQALQGSVEQIPSLEQKRDRLQEQLSRIEAAKQFETELRQLVTEGETKRDRHQLNADSALATLRDVQQFVPLLATAPVEAALTAISSGVALNTELLNALWRILADLSEQVSIAKLQQQLHQTKTELEAAYQQKTTWMTLETKQTQRMQLHEEITQLQSRLTQIKDQLASESQWQQQRQQLVNDLKQLEDPRSRCQVLQRQIQQQPSLNNQYAARRAQHANTQEQLLNLDTQLAEFADLDDRIEQQKQARQMHHANYLTYVQHRNDANQRAHLETEYQAAIAELQQLDAAHQTLQTEHDQSMQTFDPQQAITVEATYAELRSQADRIWGGLPQQRKRLLDLDQRLQQLQTVAEKRDRCQQELSQKKRTQKFITFARKAYKEAGPRITERYLQSIRREADRLFRELLNRPNVALEWTKEYEILVQEGGHTRRFINLSGGEQMCAALAVRLALLRVLADIDIAFFDEPTTNMDRPRRESLADAIANIKSFRQLFVISHDDTFEKVTENVILVQREL
jgi:DNA repair protein SbcC/Rad50